MTKCEGIGCNAKESCERFTRPALPKYQAYLCMVVTCKNPNAGCKWFISNKIEETLDAPNLIS